MIKTPPGVMHAVTEVDIPDGGHADVVIGVHDATCRVRRTGLPQVAGDVVFPAVAAERLTTGDYVSATPDAHGRLMLALRRNLTWQEIEDIAAEDPDDRQIRLAHGFYRPDDWKHDALLCRNGCGLPHGEVIAGKIRRCLGPEHEADEA